MRMTESGTCMMQADDGRGALCCGLQGPVQWYPRLEFRVGSGRRKDRVDAGCALLDGGYSRKYPMLSSAPPPSSPWRDPDTGLWRADAPPDVVLGELEKLRAKVAASAASAVRRMARRLAAAGPVSVFELAALPDHGGWNVLVPLAGALPPEAAEALARRSGKVRGGNVLVAAYDRRDRRLGYAELGRPTVSAFARFLEAAMEYRRWA